MVVSPRPYRMPAAQTGARNRRLPGRFEPRMALLTDRNSPSTRRVIAVVVACLALWFQVGCRLSWGPVDTALAIRARAALYDSPQEFPPLEEFEEEPRYEASRSRGSIGGVILGELLAVFPGLIVTGLGHYYAGDDATGSRLLRMGQLGYALAAVGGGIGAGGYFASKDDTLEDTALPISLYVTGGVIGGAGVGYVLVAWIYDIIDTPRAVLSGGRPPPRTGFVEDLDIFGD